MDAKLLREVIRGQLDELVPFIGGAMAAQRGKHGAPRAGSAPKAPKGWNHLAGMFTYSKDDFDLKIKQSPSGGWELMGTGPGGKYISQKGFGSPEEAAKAAPVKKGGLLSKLGF